MMKRKKSQVSSKKPNPNKKPLHNYLKFTGLAFQMIVTILLGVWLGMYIDEKTGMKNPIFTAILSLVAVIASVYLGVRELLK